jgi:hypothetical protein
MLVEPIYFFQHQRHYYVFVIKYSASSGYRGNSNPGNVFHEVLEIFEPVFFTDSGTGDRRLVVRVTPIFDFHQH